MRLTAIITSILIIVSSFNAFAQVHASVNVTLEFSTDGGKTFDTDFPILKEAQKVIMRAKWNVSGETRNVKDGITTTILYNEHNDFASANKGYMSKNLGWKTNAYYQRLKKYWAKYKHGKFVYALDLRARPKGVKGYKNKWDSKKKKFISAELPPCPAFKPGTYKFTVVLGYNLKKNNKRIYSKEDFFITIKDFKE